MAWTKTAREQYARRGLLYASDCTDEEWEVAELLLRPMSRVGRSLVYKRLIQSFALDRYDHERQCAKGDLFL